MGIDLVLRTIGTLSCLYTVGFFVSLMTVSALNAVSTIAGSPCAGPGCHVVYQAREEAPATAPDLVQAAAMFVAHGL